MAMNRLSRLACDEKLLRTDRLGRLLGYHAGGGWLGSSRLFGRFRFLPWRQDGVEGGSFHAGHELDYAGIAHVLNEAVDDRVSELAVRHLTTFEAQRSLDLIALTKKADGLVFLCLIIVFIHRHRKLHFLDDNDLLLFPRRAVTLVLLIEELAVVLNTAHRRLSGGRNLHQIQAPLACYFECFERRQNSQLFTVLVNDTDLTCANSVVNADKRLGRTFIDDFLQKYETKRRPLEDSIPLELP
jgi:hypothetical protein